MKSMMLVAVAVAWSLIVPAFADDLNKDDHEELEGTWKVVSSEIDGKPVSGERLKDLVLVHLHEKDGVHPFVLKRGDQNLAEGTVKHDETSKPKGFDATYTKGLDKGKTVKGIYRIEGKTLTLCWDTDDSERPKEFSSKAGSGRTLRVYQQVKGPED